VRDLAEAATGGRTIRSSDDEHRFHAGDTSDLTRRRQSKGPARQDDDAEFRNIRHSDIFDYRPERFGAILPREQTFAVRRV
jgi:hypothetical protein